MDAILDALTTQTSDLGVEEVRSYHNYNENTLFAVDLKLINADKEMKRIFGVRRSQAAMCPQCIRAHHDHASRLRALAKALGTGSEEIHGNKYGHLQMGFIAFWL